MRNTSDPIKENSNVMNAQGGEKKVMKKILSVALSTAMAFSMFASVAFGDTAVSPQQQFDALKAKGIFNGYPDGTAGLDKDMTRAEFAKVITKLLGLKEITGTLSYTDKNYTAKNWAVPYIEAVTAAGIMEGKNVEKKIFDFNGKVTVSEMATILTRALDLEIPAETNNTAPAWAKGYVQAAINAGLVDANTNFTANASRELLVGAAYAIDEAQSLKVTSYTVTEGGKVVEFKISDGETVKVTLDKALEANKETEVKFTYKEKSFTEKVTYVVEAATKVQSASSVNLKEVDVAFDGKVDKATATDKNNYSIDSNSKGIKSITLLEDGKTARLLLNESSKFVQGTTYKVVAKNVKSSTGTVLPQGEVSFTSADNVLPTVAEVKALGTKVIKVTFSEPVVAPTSSNFQLDDKAFVGSVTQGANQREVILRDYTGSISEGAHKLTTSLVEDFAGLKSLAATTDFTVAVDTEGPKVTEISATLEKVTVTFDEEIDPASVTNDSFYWKSGDTKKTGTVTQVASNVYEVQFTQANRLPGYESTLFVEVKDYSGNVNAVKEHKINATVDLVRPQVVETTFGDRTNTLTVRFDKAVSAADKKYFTIKKGDDVIPVNSVVAADSSNKIFYVTFFNTLATGTYNLKVADVQDTTALRNTLVEFNGTFVANDTANPSISSTDYNESARKVTLNFGREMDLATVNTKGNYYINFEKNGANAQNIALPTEVSVNAVNGGKSVVLQFPEFIDGTKVTFGPNGSVKGVVATGLKSKTGQVVSLDASSLKDAAANQLKWTNAVQKDAKTFELTFNQVVASANVSDFQIDGKYPASVSIDENKVTLKTADEVAGQTLVTLFANNSVETYSNNKLNLSSNASMTVNNAVAPRVTEVSTRAVVAGGQEFTITFTNSVGFIANTSQDAIANDIIVKDLSVTNTPALTPVADYEVTDVTGNTVKVLLTKTSSLDKPISVQVKDAKYLVAATTTTKAVDSSVYTVTAPSASVTNPIATGTAITAPKAAIVASADVAGIKLAANTAGANGNNIADVVVTRTNGGTDKVVISNNGATITINEDATKADVITAINETSLPYKAEAGTSADALPANGNAVTYEFANGANAEAGKLTVSLSQPVTSLVNNQVTITTAGVAKTYTASLVTSTSIEVNIGNDDVAGDQFAATVVHNNKNVAVNTTISTN
ncbi:S-layer domain-containing protein [Paenibacillus sp. FSL R5-192]|uniref:S-layer homology domain-containing protein n=1 Tax=Paenibacillus sp. FSL R5-192 TaxID=1226754 RepID=UPI0003E28816|nr:S-layer homology domain-containing protein [Paenibacillus sp. FSL R5-192]ETT41114.1 S-layer domain-containing protein [Paenibacillus sp. FSL R5-192]